MSLRPLLSSFTDVPDGAALSRGGGRAFVSSSLRPYVLAALADEDARRATLVVAGDDRQARDLAGDPRAWLHPRPVRFYPSRGVAYESHLTPPPHLVGLRPEDVFINLVEVAKENWSFGHGLAQYA